MTRVLAIGLIWILGSSTIAADPPASPSPTTATPQSWIGVTPTPHGPVLMQQGLPPPYRDYQMNRTLTPEEKKRWLRMAMPMMAHMMQMDAREAMNHFAVKFQAKPELSFDQVVESMMLRANQVNLKFVGSNLMWKDFEAVLGDTAAPRVEVFSFCDIAVGRELLKVIPELVVLLPCRIAVMEDVQKNIWVLMMDWDITWLDLAGTQSGMTPGLRLSIQQIREKMEDVMRAAASGEF